MTLQHEFQVMPFEQVEDFFGIYDHFTRLIGCSSSAKDLCFGSEQRDVQADDNRRFRRDGGHLLLKPLNLFRINSAFITAFAVLHNRVEQEKDPAVVVNATPVGMEPELKSPLQKHQLRSTMTVFDLVYTPPETPLLRIARNSRCQTIPGTEMFVRQAAAQFRHFTGIAPPLDLIRSAM